MAERGRSESADSAMEVRDGRFAYLGARFRFIARVPCERSRRALAAVEGLGGFVGVDFIWDEQRGSATILEINPRPTTSVVGLCRLLPAGPPGQGVARGVAVWRAETKSFSKVSVAWCIRRKPWFSMPSGEFADLPEPVDP